jgi:hypothetical protein
MESIPQDSASYRGVVIFRYFFRMYLVRLSQWQAVRPPKPAIGLKNSICQCYLVAVDAAATSSATASCAKTGAKLFADGR